MRIVFLALVVAVMCAAAPAAAQERFRISINAGQQATSTGVTERQNFQQYLEQGSFTFERTISRAPFYDATVGVRLWRDLYASVAMSLFEDTGAGTVTARVPHPFFFERQREVNGELTGVTRREVGAHVSIGWAMPVTDSLDVLVFGGPSSISTEQTFVTTLMLGLDKEVYPFDTLAFPGAVSAKRTQNVTGYNAGADLTWRLTDLIGAGVLIRYTGGRKTFGPTGVEPVEIKVGGLHAGGGLRLRF